MLTFSLLPSGGYRIAGGKKDVAVFPADKDQKDMLVLMPAPEETPTPGVISWPGEYNEAGISIRGIGHDEGQQVSYVAEIDGIRCGLLSSPLCDWSDKQIELVGDLHVLMIPAEDPKLVQKLVDEFDPRVLILIPSKHKGDLPGLSKSLGVKETVSEYKVKSLPAEGRETVVLA